MTAVVVAIVLLSSELPDPGLPSFTTLCAGFGMFLGGVLGWLRRRPVAPLVTGGGVVGFGVGLVGWLTVLAIDRL